MAKKVFTIFSLLIILTSTTLMAQKVEDVLGVNKLTFNGVKYKLGWSVHNTTQYMQEYYPKGQGPESFTDMFTISIHKTSEITPKMAVEAKAAELEQRKDVFNYATCASPDNKEYIIDLICYQGTEEALEFVEFDVQKYKIIQVDGQPALQLLFFTHRVYGDDIMPFLKDKLATFRSESINALIPFSVDCKVKSN